MSVTAVPLRPVTKGTVPKLWIGLLLVALLGAGLAFLGTSRVQFVDANDGLRYRVWEAGSGEPVTAADLIVAEVEQRDPTGKVVASTRTSGQNPPLSSDNFPAFLRPLMFQMREGGAYQIMAPLRLWLPPGSPSPSTEFGLDDLTETRIKVYRIVRDGVAMQQQQQQEQMMQQQALQQQLQEMQARGGGRSGGSAGAGVGGEGPGDPAPAPSAASPRSGR